MPRVTITPPGKTSQPYRFTLDRQAVTMGRGSENDMVIDCSSVSVNHAVMERVPGGFQLRDLGSTNGTKLSGVSREVTPLIDERKVMLGDVEFHFSLTEEEQTSLAAEDEAPPAVIREKAEEPREPRIRQSVATSSPSSSKMPTALFLLMALVALYLGFSIRYSSENPGRSFLKDLKAGEIQAKEKEQEAAVEALPAPEAGVEIE